MLKKPFYVHVQTPGGRSLGFSALIDWVVPFNGPDAYKNFNNGDMMCFVAITYCNAKDKHFNKKIARQVLANKAQELVRVRDLPIVLGKADRKAYGLPLF